MEWSPATAYCVGLVATDGNLSGDGRHVEFTSKDSELVAIIQAQFGRTNRITMKSRSAGAPKKYFRIQISNVRLYRWLQTIGLTSRKSLTLGILRIPGEFFRDFLRGCLDGDGNIMVYDDPVFPNSRRLYVRFVSGSATHLDWMQQKIQQLWSLHGYRSTVPRAFRLNYAKTESIALLKKIYYAPSLPCLPRKRQLAAPFFGCSSGGGETGKRAGLRSLCRKA